MALRRSLLPLLAAGVSAAAMVAFVDAYNLQRGTFRVYGTTTDVMPHKETLFFVAFSLFGLAATFFAALALARLAGDRLVAGARVLVRHPLAVVAAAAVVSLVATALVSWLSLQHTTVLLDEDLYRFQVDLLRRGELYTTLPDPLGPFREFYSMQADGKWSGIYPWGHIAAILPGYLVGAPYLVPHLCAPLTVILTYAIGREVFPDDEVTPLVAAGVVALSPFVAFSCGTTHNSTTSLVFINLGLWGLARAVRRSSTASALLAGLAFGLGLHMRPLNAVAVAVPVGIVALIAAHRMRRPLLPLVAGFAVGLVPGVVAYLALNLAITGDPLLTPAALSMPKDISLFGFDNTVVPHTPLLAFGKSGTNLIRVVLWTTGSLLGGLGLLAFVAGLRRRSSDLLLLVPVVSLFLCYYFFFTSPGSDTGPLYYLDLVPVLALAVGRALVAVVDRFGSAPDRPLRFASAALISSYVVALAGFWPMQGIAGRHVTDNNLLPYRAVERAGIHDAVVWFDKNPNFKSWKLPPIPPHPDLSDDVLYARYDASWARKLWRKLRATRTFYTLVFDEDGEAEVRVWYP